MTYTNPTSSDPLCNVCRIPAATHPRCGNDLPAEEACHVFIGPLHVDKVLIDGLCASCWRANQVPAVRARKVTLAVESEHQACMRAVQGR